jgi:hypothetical protein
MQYTKYKVIQNTNYKATATATATGAAASFSADF